MQPAIVNVSTPPATTISVDTVVYIGQNQIRRNVAKSTTLSVVESVVDRVIAVRAAETISIPAETGYVINQVYVQSDSPITLTISAQAGDTVVPVNKLLVMDTNLGLSLTLENSGTLEAKVRLIYGMVRAPIAF